MNTDYQDIKSYKKTKNLCPNLTCQSSIWVDCKSNGEVCSLDVDMLYPIY